MLDMLGPLGHGFVPNSASRNLLLIAGGIGIAPLVALAERGMAEGLQVTLLLGAPTQAQLYPANLLPPQARVLLATEDGTAGIRGMVTDLVAGLVREADQIFACGPTSMYKAMASQGAQILEGKSVQISLEARMGCGMGYCYGCSVETKRGLKQICKDGPVFDLHDIFR